MKIHAKDYLNEFKASQPLWLKTLIDEAINSNGNILEKQLSSIYKLLKNEVEESTLANITQVTNSIDKLILKKLTHNSGINALKNQQSISFSENCNILFGLNGSGKSSYFRIFCIWQIIAFIIHVAKGIIQLIILNYFINHF